MEFIFDGMIVACNLCVKIIAGAFLSIIFIIPKPETQQTKVSLPTLSTAQPFGISRGRKYVKMSRYSTWLPGTTFFLVSLPLAEQLVSVSDIADKEAT